MAAQFLIAGSNVIAVDINFIYETKTLAKLKGDHKTNLSN